MSAPQWLPNWIEQDQYPPEDTPGREWRWQFLRRNPVYQKDWQEIALPHIGDDGSYGDGDYFEHFRETYGLIMPVDPCRARVGGVWRQDWITKIVGYHVDPLPPGQVAIVFDLGRAIGPQIKKADTHLKNVQSGMQSSGEIERAGIIKPNKSLYREYLRILDAKSVGVSNRTIAETLFPDESPSRSGEDTRAGRVKDRLRKARFMRDHGYRDIPGG